MFVLDGKGIEISDDSGRYLRRLSRLTDKTLGYCLDEALELSMARYKSMLDEIDAIIAKYENPVAPVNKGQPKIRKKPGPKPKAEKAEKMTKEEFMEYFDNRELNRAKSVADQLKTEEEF